ncbi:MAG: hypothetical protein M3040_15335 [Bacteroidota bacterium]|nr:hypothetical protein [Bacteroidota bacterium]
MLLQKRRRSFIVIAAVIGLFLIIGTIFYKAKKHAFLDHQLKEMVKDKTHQLYNINYDSISVDEVGGNLYIKNIYIKGDTSLQQQMISNKDSNAAPAIFDIYVPTIEVVAFKTAKALLSKQMECREIIITDPVVNIFLFPGQSKQTDSRKKQEELYKQILGKFKLIKADSVSVINSQVIATDFFTKQVKFHTYNTSVNLSGVAIDSTYNQDRTRTLFCQQIQVHSDKIILGEKRNTAEISNVTFDTRSKIVKLSSISYDAVKNGGFFKTKLEGIALNGIEWLGPVENSDLIINAAVFDKGELETLVDETKEDKAKPKKEGKILTGWIRRFELNSLRIKAITYISRSSKTKEKPLVVRNNAFLIKHFSIDRTSAFNGKLINQAKEIELSNDAISVKSADRFYEYKVSGIKLNTLAKSIFIKTLQVIPQFDEAAFAKRAHYQTDRFDILFRNLTCNNVDAEKLVKGEINIGAISTAGNSIKVFRDLSYPVDSISKSGPQMTYPHQLIHKLGLPIEINRLNISNTNIEYKEKNATSKNSGRVRFSNSSITINNLSTIKPKQGEQMRVNFKTNFLDQIPLTGRFTFSLQQWQKGTFTAEASVASPFDATLLNQLTEPMALMKVEKGEINSVKFTMSADTNTSNGVLILPYRDLKISLLKKKGDQYSKKGIVSLFANIIVKNNNKEGDNMRTAKVLLTRNKFRTFFNFIWMTIFKGIRDVSVLKI